MTYVEPIAPVEEGASSLDTTDLEQFGASLALTQADLYAMDGIDQMEQWLASLDQVKADRASEAGPHAGPVVTSMLDQLGEAVRDGELGTHDAAQALSWVTSRLGSINLAHHVAAGDPLAPLFALYDKSRGYDTAARRRPPGQAHHAAGTSPGLITTFYTVPSYHVPEPTQAPTYVPPRTPAAPSRSPSSAPAAPVAVPFAPSAPVAVSSPPAEPSSSRPSPTAPIATPGGPAAAPASVGEAMVRRAEEQIVSRRIEVPGFDAAEADAITTGLAITYQDLTVVIADVVTEVLRQIDAHALVINRTVDQVTHITEQVQVKAPVTQLQYDDLLKRVERLQRDLIHTTTEVQRLERTKAPAAGRAPAGVRDLATITRVQENHGAAIKQLFTTIAPLALLAPVVPTLVKLTPQLLAQLQATATEVETCVVTTCPGPRNLEQLLKRELPKLLGFAQLAGLGAFLEQAIQDPTRTAGIVSDAAGAIEPAAVDLVDLLKAL